jgi:hypothetical protein
MFLDRKERINKIGNKKFNMHHDAGHGWLAVKIQDLIDLEIIHKISKYSYTKGKTIYLEEDMDASTFITKYKELYGKRPYINDLEQRKDRSPIRSFKTWSYDKFVNDNTTTYVIKLGGN